MGDPAPWPFSDTQLARRLERTEGKSNADFVDARSRVDPASGACWVEVDGTFAMFDGVGSPLTQTFGLGIDVRASEETLGKVELFFRERGAEVFHEVSPLADPSVIPLLNARGYQPVELSTVLVRPLDLDVDSSPPRSDGVVTRVARRDEAELWAETSARGWSETAEAAAFVRALGAVMMESRCTTPFFAEIDGRPVATGGLNIHDGVALFAGASTIPGFRNRGAQNAMLSDRLRFAAQSGCDLAMMVALPGSGSQRNAERSGFRVAYTRTKWQLAK
ncbi:MAG: GNAT family N-acetyltransferase [Acidobacteria bacterium]|nr:GNAT family N-acetyltransferase [Acidobacteriota bacterium]